MHTGEKQFLILFPMYLFENGADPLPFRRIDHFNERHLSLKVRAEIRAPVTILTPRSVADAIRQHRFQPIEVAAQDIRFLVGHKPSQVLPHTFPHHAGLAMIHPQSLLLHNGGRAHAETFDALFKIVISGKGEVVGITRVDGSGGFSGGGGSFGGGGASGRW